MHTLADGEPLSSDQAQADAAIVMGALDEDKSGTIERSEFVDWVVAGLNVPKAVRDAGMVGTDSNARLQTFLHSVETLANELEGKSAAPAPTVPQAAAVYSAPPKPAKKSGLKRSKTEIML